MCYTEILTCNLASSSMSLLWSVNNIVSFGMFAPTYLKSSDVLA